MFNSFPKLTTFVFLTGSTALGFFVNPLDFRQESPAAAIAPASPAAACGGLASESSSNARDPRSTAELAETDRLLREAWQLILRNETVSAERNLLICVELAHDHALCHRTLGELYRRSNRPEDAVRHLRRYAELRPAAPDAQRVRPHIEHIVR